jgi:hypothetical protein
LDPILHKHLRAAYRGDLAARRGLLQHLRYLGYGCLANVLAAVFSPDVVHLDGWALAQIASVFRLTDEELNDIMPWRSATATCRVVAEAMKEHTGRVWQVRVVGSLGLVVGPPNSRLIQNKELSQNDRDTLAERFVTQPKLIKFPGMVFPETVHGFRECVYRAEGREYVYDLEELRL